MEYRVPGGTGVKVSHLCLGAMMFGDWGSTDHAECVRIMRAALDGGVDFVDTADVYSHGESEEIVAKAPEGGRERVVLATKFQDIIGPRTMDHLNDLLAGQDVVLDEATLDRIDELVAPATNVTPADAGWTWPALATTARRRS